MLARLSRRTPAFLVSTGRCWVVGTRYQKCYIRREDGLLTLAIINQINGDDAWELKTRGPRVCDGWRGLREPNSSNYSSSTSLQRASKGTYCTLTIPYCDCLRPTAFVFLGVCSGLPPASQIFFSYTVPRCQTFLRSLSSNNRTENYYIFGRVCAAFLLKITFR